MLPFGLTIFWGAFLLFLVQPLIAKFILPWFGGSAAVWTTCMLFFQVVLLGGYAGAHWLVTRFPPRRQVLVYLGALAVALLFLPLRPGDGWKPVDGAMPAARILMLLAATLGFPYLVLSATGPLMQAWFTRAYAGLSPYRLYAVSNVGSLLALVSYPLFFERYLTRGVQAAIWSVGLAVFAVLVAMCGRIVWKRGDGPVDEAVAHEPEMVDARRWLWFALPACASVLLLAVTNKICQDMAVIPFLWVAPLVVYLLSFIISFDSPRWYVRRLWLPLFVISVAAIFWVMVSEKVPRPNLADADWRWVHWLEVALNWVLQKGVSLPMPDAIGVYVAALFVCCMVCHGEVYRLRPAPRRLSGYYLLISAGGAFGGFVVAVVAPLVFRDYLELHVGLLVAVVLVAAVLVVDPKSWLHRARPRWAFALVVLAVLATGYGAYWDKSMREENAVEMSRSFFGVLKVYEENPATPTEHVLMLQHGSTDHGSQFVMPAKSRRPTAYYVYGSGIGRALQSTAHSGGRRIGVVGLGTGTLAAYGEPGDLIRFYEIDRNVLRLAKSRFSYLEQSQAKIDISFGDARLSMEREQDEPFDLIALDAFSGDAIPVHLLTREAFEIYLRRLKPAGIIAVHISNRYLDLQPVVVAAATHFNLRRAFIVLGDENFSEEDATSGYYHSDWILLSRSAETLASPVIAEATIEFTPDAAKSKMWTDDWSNLLPILKFD